MSAARFFRSELALIFGRGRNRVGLIGLACVPLIMAVAVRVSDTTDGPNFIGSITGNGMFVALAALTAAMPLFLPVAVAAISGDAIAGEASIGTLRYLLTVPVSRNRLLTQKFAAITVFCGASTAVIAASGVVIGWMLFPIGDVTLLSGTEVSQLDGVVRLVGVCGYVTLCMVALGAVGLFISALTEQPVAAMIGTLAITVVLEIANAIPQLSAIHPYLFVHYWMNFGDLLRTPVVWDGMREGALVSLAYIAVFTSATWARFTTKDISS